MGGVGDKAGHALLGHHLDGEGLLILLEHCVQRPLERADLGGRGLGDRYACGQVTFGDPPRHGLDLAQWAEGTDDEVSGCQRTKEDDGHVRHGHDEPGAGHGLHHSAQRQRDRDDAAVLLGVGVLDR